MTLCYISFCCPISISVSFLASPAAPSWMEHSGDCVPSWEWDGGACKDILTPTGRRRNSLVPLCCHDSSQVPFKWGRGSSQLWGLGESHQCPCLISSACISLTFSPACLLQTDFWRALSELCISDLLHPLGTVHALHLSRGSGAAGKGGWAPQHPPPRLLQHPCPGPGRNSCSKALGNDSSLVTQQQSGRRSFYLELVKR